MNRPRWERIVAIFSLLLLTFGVFATAQTSDALAQQTGLDSDLIGVIEVSVDGTELAIVFVFINERTFDSGVSATLQSRLLPYVGQNALYVNPSVEIVVSQFAFEPLDVSVGPASGGSIDMTLALWQEITPGFLDGRFTVNPSGAGQGSGSEGILILGDSIDSSEPFVVEYGGQTVLFDIDDVSTVATATVSTGSTSGLTSETAYDPVDVTTLENVATLADLLALNELTPGGLAEVSALPAERVGMIEYVAGTERLRIVLIQLVEDVRDSALGDDLLATLDPLIGSGAVMIWAYSPTGAPFRVWDFVIKQSGTHYWYTADDSFVDLTEGFRRMERLEAGEVAAGVMRLHSRMDQDAPFSVFYKSLTIGEVAFP